MPVVLVQLVVKHLLAEGYADYVVGLNLVLQQTHRLTVRCVLQLTQLLVEAAISRGQGHVVP